MTSDEELLEGIARDGTMDYSQWPGLLERILPRLEHIVYYKFPIPTTTLPDPLPPSMNAETKPSSQSADSSQKENAHPSSPSRPSRTPPIPFRPTSNNSESAPSGTLPPPLISLLSSIQTTLKTSFSTCPPHTAQRLAELLLRPRTHYRTLPSYLRALDRVVSVSSPLSLFPLPSIASPSSNTLANGLLQNGSSTPTDTPDGTNSAGTEDDDFIGGAALTPIPWLINHPSSPASSTSTTAPRPLNIPTNNDLRTESTSLIDGPNGSGSIETVSVTVNGIASTPSHAPTNNSSGGSGRAGGITQGELLRQEQEAGIVPVPAPMPSGRVTRSSSAAAANNTRKEEENAVSAVTAGTEELEERVHARGPEVVGVEDMGPQARGMGSAEFDVEAAVGRKGEGEDMVDSFASHKRKEKERDADGDIIVADADGLPEGKERREGKGADAVDATAL